MGLESQIAGLLYPGVLTCPIERSRHEEFILRQLLAPVAAAAIAPVYLALNGAPNLFAAMVFVWLIMPLAAIALLSFTGRLVLAQALATFCLMAAGVSAAVGGNQAGLAWLILAPLESIFSRSQLLLWLSGLLAVLAVLAIVALDGLNAGPSQPRESGDAFFLIPAIIYVAVSGFGFIRLRAKRREADRRLAERYRALTETIGDLVVTTDRSGAVTSLSRDCQNLFGLSPGELLGRGLFERVHVADRPAFLKAIADSSLGSTTAKATLRLRTSTLINRGQYAEPVFLWLEMRARRCDAAEGQSQKAEKRDAEAEGEAIAVFRDVTKTKLRQAELEAARASAEEASYAKDHFLANVSHELRTPLNAIIGFSEILSNLELSPTEPDKQREYARIIHQSGQHLLTVVNSILDLSKIRSGSFDILPEPFSVRQLVDLCCEMVELDAVQAGIELRRACSDAIGEVIGDKRACKQIIINLLSNALKFTPAGGLVTVGARPEGNSIVLTVADTGAGISAADLIRLGDPFFQAKASLDRPFEGTGLGLSIVRGLIGLQGGAIALASEPGKGTCVFVRLPLDCRRLIDKARGSATIETIPRYSRGDDERDLFRLMTVKKIA